MRLAKHLAHAGIASRRASEQLIFDGRVEVDGTVVTDPARDVGGEEHIRVDGKTLRAPERGAQRHHPFVQQFERMQELVVEQFGGLLPGEVDLQLGLRHQAQRLVRSSRLRVSPRSRPSRSATASPDSL
ncbi:MAG: S4 domain-containing protein [Gaiellaceae bacterium MAG52_C11]|nr:S4 domain-containing protein [Candidatus Gaiellasilicea maunaloa]